MYRQMAAFLLLIGATGCVDKQPEPNVGSAPVALFSMNVTRAQVGEVIRFTDGSTDPDNDIVSWVWDFADGSPVVKTRNPEFIFQKAGSYLVSLQVTDRNYRSSTFTKRILVKHTSLPDYGTLGMGIRQKISLLFPKAMVCAHRAYHENFPENSIAAINAGISAQINIVEIDVRLTLDNEVAVIHDATTARTTNGNLTVAKQLMNELKQLRLLHNGAVTLHQIPTLRECLIAARGKIYMNIDASWDNAVSYYNKIYNEVAAQNMVDMVFFYTESASVAKGLMELDGDVVVLVGTGNPTDWLFANNMSPKAKLWHLAAGTLNSNFTAGPFSEGIRFFANAYVNSPQIPPLSGADAVTDNLLNNKVSIIQTDYPVSLIQYLHTRGFWLQ
jgi:glycerophosphoryl diester phosphodiesterase